MGGLGSGKSEAGIIRIILLMMENYSKTRKPIDCLIAFPTYDLCRLRGLNGIKEMLDRSSIKYTENKSNYSIFMPPFGTILLRSYDRPERIVAFQCAHSVCDELDTLQKEKAEFVWRKVSERTRQPAYRKNSVAVVTTPDQGYSGFTYEKWVKKRQKGYELIKAATASNPFLPDGYIDQIRANYDPILADMYLNGEFVSLSQNKVYHFFDRAKHHSDRELMPTDKIVCFALDFNVGGTCASVWVLDNNIPVAVDEFVSHDTQDFIIRAQQYAEAGRQLIVYPDASGKGRSTNASQTDVQMIQQAGLRVDAPNANPPVRDRVNAVNALLAHGKLLVNTAKCLLLTDAFESQGYDSKGDPEKFNEHPAIDDWVDGAGYYLHRKFPISRPVFITGIHSAM